MKKVFTILGITAAALTTILAVLPISNLAYLPAIAAFIFGSIAYFLSKKEGHIKKIIPFIFFLTLSSLSITVYKSLFNKSEVANNEILEEKEIESENEAIEELESLDIDVSELEDIDLDL